MSCFGPGYDPQPTRVWSRVQNRCNDISSQGQQIFIPYLNASFSPSVAQKQLDYIRKGNVLQYKANSSNLTKMQRYSQIAKGMWVNRNTTWATQTETSSNPNTTSLKRVGYTNIDTTTGVSTTLPLTCPPKTPIVPVVPSDLPVNAGGAPAVPELPPPPPPGPVGKPIEMPPVMDEPPVPAPVVIADGGNLLCNVVENICTGEVISVKINPSYYPTSDSDVPGKIEYLYWNERIQTWYPRQRYVMTNSANKFPQGYKGFVSAIRPTTTLAPTTPRVASSG